MATAMVTAMDMDMARRPRADRPSNRLRIAPFDRTKLPRLIAFAACGLVLAAMSAKQSALVIYDRRNPVLSEQLLGSDNARIKLWTAKTLSAPNAIRDARILDYARSSLRSNPLNANALRAMAFYYDARDRETARRLALLSDRVTRRDPLTQLLLTEYAARAGDADGALARLDTALTTIGKGREQVFPIISAQLRNAGLRKALPALVKPRNIWMAEYLDHVMRHEQDGSKFAAEILLATKPADSEAVYAKMGSGLISGLAEAGELDLLKRTYARARGSRPDVTARPAIDHLTSDPAIGWLGWSGVGDGSTGSTLRTNAKGGEAVVYVAAGTNRALVLRRVLFLPPGRYLHIEKRTPSFGPPGTIGQYEMKCIGGNASTIWKGPPADHATGATGTGGPEIPAWCQAQVLELFVSSPLGAGGSEFVIEDFDLRRAG